jgi:homoserine dehydrogenase
MKIRIAMTGFGTVGQGVATLIREHGDEYERLYGVRLSLTAVADRGGAATDANGLDLDALLRAKADSGTVATYLGGKRDLAGDAFLDAADAQVLIEASSTNFQDAEPGWSYARGALARGMDLVLASKGALVLHFRELFDAASAGDRRILFGATVGAPLPVLELADRVLTGTTLTAVEGIFNATTNSILTSMEDGLSYDEGVRRAQASGIAETDPTLDVDGWDAAAKAVILANALFGANLHLDDVPREGIRGVTKADLQAAREAGESIRLIARIARDGEGVRATVGPVRRPLTDTLGRLRNEEMGVVMHAEPLGLMDSTVQATGGIPTALTVLRDIFNLARERGWRDR